MFQWTYPGAGSTMTFGARHLQLVSTGLLLKTQWPYRVLSVRLTDYFGIEWRGVSYKTALCEREVEGLTLPWTTFDEAHQQTGREGKWRDAMKICIISIVIRRSARRVAGGCLLGGLAGGGRGAGIGALAGAGYRRTYCESGSTQPRSILLVA
jgi:hypothetical protein